MANIDLGANRGISRTIVHRESKSSPINVLSARPSLALLGSERRCTIRDNTATKVDCHRRDEAIRNGAALITRTDQRRPARALNRRRSRAAKASRGQSPFEPVVRLPASFESDVNSLDWTGPPFGPVGPGALSAKLLRERLRQVLLPNVNAQPRALDASAFGAI
jgi:hypothetical protein